MRICGDPDWRVLVSGSVNYSEGVPIGRNTKMPRTPAVYRRKIRWRSYVDELADGRGPDSRENYRSVQGHEDELEAQFKEEEALGMMQLVSEEAAKREFGSTLVVAALGALQKSDSSWRVLHDGTHGVEVNPFVRLRDHHGAPGVAEQRALVAAKRALVATTKKSKRRSNAWPPRRAQPPWAKKATTKYRCAGCAN